MRIIGLTGGIASGKSTVRDMLVQQGATVLDADAVYHELIEPRAGQPSELALAIAARFPGVLTHSGAIDRRRLAAHVFDDPREREALGQITHPAIAQETARRFQALAAQGQDLVIYDVPLLYERGLEQSMDGVIVVWVPRALQLERLQKRDGLSEEAAQKRLAAQGSLDDKRDAATWVIDNTGLRAATEAQVKNLWQKLCTKQAPRP